LRNRCCASAHVLLEVLVLHLLGQVGCEHNLHSLVDEVDVCETELQNDVVIEFKHVLNGEEYGSKGVLNDVLTHLASGCDGHGVSVDHAEALLEDGALRLGRGDLLLVVVSNRQRLQSLVDNEAGPETDYRYKMVESIISYFK